MHPSVQGDVVFGEKRRNFPFSVCMTVLLVLGWWYFALLRIYKYIYTACRCVLLFIVSIHIVKILAGKAKAKRASDDSSEASSEDYGDDDDEEEGKYEIEEDEEELEDDGDSDGESCSWAQGRELLPALGTGASLHFGGSLTKEPSPLFLLCCCSELQGLHTHTVDGETWQFCVYVESEGVKAFAGLALTSHQSLSSLFRGLLQRGSNKLFKRSPPHRVQKPGTETSLAGMGGCRVHFAPHLSRAWGARCCTA